MKQIIKSILDSDLYKFTQQYMVIKLTMINGVPVVKLSDSPGKAIGDKKMVEVMKYIHIDNCKF